MSLPSSRDGAATTAKEKSKDTGSPIKSGMTDKVSWMPERLPHPSPLPGGEGEKRDKACPCLRTEVARLLL